MYLGFGSVSENPGGTFEAMIKTLSDGNGRDLKMGGAGFSLKRTSLYQGLRESLKMCLTWKL